MVRPETKRATRHAPRQRVALFCRLRLLHFAGARVEAIYVGWIIIRVVVDRAARVPEGTPAAQVLISAVPLTSSVNAWCRQSHHGEHDSGEA